MPQRAPASIDMLQTVNRPSIDRERIAGPQNSIAWPVAPPTPMWAMTESTMSLAATPGAARNVDPHALGLALPYRLRHQHVRHLGRTDAERISAERAVRRSMAVTAHNQQSRQGETLLGTDHVYDPLPGIPEPEQNDAVPRRVGLEQTHHACDLGIGDARA